MYNRSALLSRGVHFMIFSIILISGAQSLVKALDTLPLTQIIFVRGLISLLLCGFLLPEQPDLFKGKNYWMLIGRGLIGTLSMISFFYTLQHIPLATAVTIGHLSPVFLGILAMIYLKEKISGLQWIAVAISFAGVLLIKGFDVRISWSEMVIAIISTLLAAIAHFLVRRLKDEKPATVIFYFSATIIPFLGPYVLTNWQTPSVNEWLLLIFIGLGSHFGQLFLTKALKEEEIGNIQAIYYLGIFISATIGFLIYGETFNLLTLSGISLLLFGVILGVYSSKSGKMR